MHINLHIICNAHKSCVNLHNLPYANNTPMFIISTQRDSLLGGYSSSNIRVTSGGNRRDRGTIQWDIGET